MSRDGAHALTLIAFLGSVFSPYYSWARRRGLPYPLDHCAINVALAGPRAVRWSMTERGARRVVREQTRLAIGRSAWRWTGNELSISIDEVCAPVPRRIRGTIRLLPSALGDSSFALDPSGRHRWTPYAPCAHAEVCLDEPQMRWSGSAYFDSNCGEEPLEDAFRAWTWSRASSPQRGVVLYEVMPRAALDGDADSLALRFDANGCAEAMEPPPRVALPATRWGIARHTRADFGCETRVIRTLVSAPFYSRSLLRTRLAATETLAIHESLDLDRFRSPWVQCLLPFRMPRRA